MNHQQTPNDSVTELQPGFVQKAFLNIMHLN